MDTNAIEIRGLCKRYKDFALENLNLDLPYGCVLGLVGENGAGKSTTIRLIMDALERDAGTVSVLGTDNRSRAFQDLKEDIGVVLDETFVPEVMSARQLGKVMAGTYRNWDQAAYDGWLKKFQLPLDKKFKDYSRGMTMKLGIAAALSHHARLLLLDEATGGLDPMVREELLEVFADFAAQETASGHAVLLSSHIVSDLERICDYIAFLHKGKLVLCEEKDVLLDRYGILKCSKEQLANIPEEAIHGKRVGTYGVEALVEREFMPRDVVVDRANLEDIILYMVKGET
ncbi:MAG: ABC transporter ATP-binding protein [Oscillibacter sp.]|nr:ABC transporter ATP-binding protein [Oscillibacter sp.]